VLLDDVLHRDELAALGHAGVLVRQDREPGYNVGKVMEKEIELEHHHRAGRSAQ
jgi:hypothetical protein